MAETDSTLHWDQKALCGKPQNSHIDFFSSDAEEKSEAKNLCHSCPVRKDCIKYALETSRIHGVWGGKDENEIRRTLSVNAEGIEVRRGRYPQCPYCNARTSKLKVKTINLEGGGRWSTAKVVECTVCDFEWRSRSSANAVVAYHTERAVKDARAYKAEIDEANKELEKAVQDTKASEAAQNKAQTRYDNELAKAPKSPATLASWEILKTQKKTHRLAQAVVVRQTRKVEGLTALYEESYARSKSSPTEGK